VNKTTGGARVKRQPAPNKAAARFAEIERRLYEAMDKPKPTSTITRHGRTTVKRMVTKLANIAGTRRLKSHSQTFARAAAKLEIKGDIIADRTADNSVSTLERWLNGYTPLPKPTRTVEQPKPTHAPSPCPVCRRQASQPAIKTTVTFADAWTESQIAPLGFKAKDTLAIQQIDQPEQGEIIILFQPGRKGMSVGRFVEFADDEDDQPCVWIEEGDGKVSGWGLSTNKCWRILTVTRCEAFNGRATGDVKDDKARRLASLRRRLKNIDADDITDSTARFNVEREIYRLENEPTPAEWQGFDLVNA
jgi:hypothetical protein